MPLAPHELVKTRISGQTWDVKHLSGNRYQLTPSENAGGYIIGTGAGDTYVLDLKKACVLVAIHAIHTTSAKALDTTAFDWAFERMADEALAQLLPFVSYSATTVSRFIEGFGGQFSLDNAIYQITLNLAATHRLYLALVMDVL